MAYVIWLYHLMTYGLLGCLMTIRVNTYLAYHNNFYPYSPKTIRPPHIIREFLWK